MDSKQTRILIGVIALVSLVCLIAPFLLSTSEPELPQSQSPSAFDATRAYRAIEEFVTRFPRRVLGSLESRQSTGYLHDYLEKLGYTVDYSHFDARIAGRKRVGRNVLAFRQGQRPEILALIAHFDTANTTVQGAMKNGAGVGVLLEIARILAAGPTHRSLLFVFSDGEEWGMLGVKDLAESYPGRNRIVAALSLDHVAIGDLAGFCLEVTGQMKGFTPPWLRQMARRSAEAQSLPVHSPSGLQEVLERALNISWADQGPFLAAGIPAINLGSESMNRALEKLVYHSPHDTMENLKVGSVGKYGLAAERIVRSLDELQSIPWESSGSFRLRKALFLKPNVVLVLHILAFLPLPFAFYCHLRNYRRQLTLARMERELLAYAGTLLPLGSIYFLVKFLRVARLIPLYGLYPATLKDPVLENPPWGLLWGVFGAAFFIAAVCYLIGRFSLQDSAKPEFHVSKLTLLGLMLGIVALALSYNSYWALLFLGLPAWIWALVGCSHLSGRRIRNWTWIAAAGIPYCVVLWVCASRLGMGGNFIWYQVLALSTGMFPATGYYLGAASVALGIRFLAIQTHKAA